MVSPGNEIRKKLADRRMDVYFTSIEVQLIDGTTDGACTVVYKLEGGLTEEDEISAKKVLLELANDHGIHAITAES